MPDNLIKLRPSSLVVDIPPSETPPDVYTEIKNCQFREAFAVKSLGWKRIFLQPPSPPQYLVNLFDGTLNYWVAACEDGVYISDTVNPWFNITPATFQPCDSNRWSHALINGKLVLNNGEFEPCYWSGFGAMTTLPDWPADTLVAWVRSHKYHLFAGNVLAPAAMPNRVMWSDSAEPGTVPQEWTPSPTNEAGFVDLASTEVPCVDGLTLRGAFIVYKHSSCYRFNYVGGTFVFTNTKIFGTVGLLALNCVIEYEGMHYILSDGDIYAHDSQNIVSLVDKTVKRFVFDQINSAARDTCYLAADRANNEILFCLAGPDKDVPSNALVWDTRREKIGFREIGEANFITSGIVTVANASNAWQDDTASWASDITRWNATEFSAVDDGMLIANATKNWIYHLDGSIDQDGEPVDFLVAKSYMDMGTPTTFKLVKRIWPHMTATAGGLLTVRVGGSASPSGAITWSDPVTFDPATANKVDTFAAGRYLSFQFTAPQDQQIQFNGWDVELGDTGRF